MMRLMMIFAFVIPLAVAQRPGTGGGAARGFAGHGPVRGFESGFYRGFGGLNPYAYGPLSYGFWGDDMDWADYPYSRAYAPEPLPPPQTSVVFLAPPAPPLPPRPVTPLIHDYTSAPESAAAIPATFTVALKDGTQLLAVAAWVQAGKLHLVDTQDKQQVLSPDVIDREATNRSNAEKHLRLQLPPG